MFCYSIKTSKFEKMKETKKVGKLLRTSLVSIIFLTIHLFKKKTLRASNSLDQDQGPNCLQRLSADDTSRYAPFSGADLWMLSVTSEAVHTTS